MGEIGIERCEALEDRFAGRIQPDEKRIHRRDAVFIAGGFSESIRRVHATSVAGRESTDDDRGETDLRRSPLTPRRLAITALSLRALDFRRDAERVAITTERDGVYDRERPERSDDDERHNRRG